MTPSLLAVKIKATAFHFLITTVVAIALGLLIFIVWYPNNLASYIGGTELYRLVILVELAVGPLMSLVIFNPAKPNTELVRDYCVVGVFQLSALLYGLYVVAETRPIFLVFVKDRLEVVSAIDLSQAQLDEAKIEDFASFPWLGPKRICVEFPNNPEERNRILFSAVAGRDIQFFPKYYRECADNEAISSAHAGQQLRKIVSSKQLEVQLPKNHFTWFPVAHSVGAFVEIYPSGEEDKKYFLPVNPFEQ